MGCHTWLYRNVNTFSKNEKKRKIAKLIKELKNSRLANGTYEQWLVPINQIKKRNPEFLDNEDLKQYYENLINELMTSILRLEIGDFNEVLKRCASFEYNGKYYIPCVQDCGDNIVRVGHYPEGKFTTAQDLIDFLYSCPNGNVYYYDTNGEYQIGMCLEIENRIRAFFKETRDGLIAFG